MLRISPSAVPGLVTFGLLAALGGCDARPAPLPARDAFAGSAACKQCHAKKFKRWSKDWHARALAKASAEAIAGEFDDTHYQGASSEAWLRHDGERYVIRTRDAEGRLADHRVDWVLGGKRMQDPLTVFADGRWQVLPVYYHVTGGGEWVDYNEAQQGIVTADHPFFWTNFRRTANHECLDCHSTGLEVGYDASSHRWSTRFADPGVACESCHGPGARHAATEAEADVVHPANVDDELGLAICAQCHGPRIPLFPLLDAEHRFRPGQRYEDRYVPVLIVLGSGRSGDFFADGRPSGSSFEYQALLQSRCYLEGGATCLTCHTAPHDHHGAQELDTAAVPAAFGDTTAADATCFGCHAEVFADRLEHTRHSSSAGQSCTGCHMPKVLESVLDRFADHAIDVPVPQNTLRHGVPNACNQCHESDTPEAMAAAIERWWPRASERQARRLRLADAIDEQTAAASRPALEAVIADVDEAPELRGVAANLLAQRFPEAAAAVVVPWLGRASAVLRAQLLQALGVAGSRESADEVARWVDDPALQVRQMAALVSSSFGDPRGLAALERLTRDPETRGLPRPHQALADHLARRGDLDGAIAELEIARRQKPYDTGALVGLADLHARKGELPRARELLQETLRFDPRHRGALGRLRAMDGER